MKTEIKIMALRKRILAALLIPAMVLSLISLSPQTAFAAAAYPVWVGGVQVTDANKDNVLGNTGTPTVTYDPVSNKLTLNNANIQVADCPENFAGSVDKVGIASDTTSGFIIELMGDNSIVSDEPSGETTGIYLNVSNSTIKGDGSLNISFADNASAQKNRGISGINIFIRGNAAVKVNSGDASETSYGIWSYQDNCSIYDNAKVEVSAGNAPESIGIKGTVNCIDEAELVARGYTTAIKKVRLVSTTNWEIKAGTDIDGSDADYAEQGVLMDESLMAGYRYLSIKPGEQIEMYDIWLGGKRITSKNKDNVLGDTGTPTVVYDPVTNILTLNNATIQDMKNIGRESIGVIFLKKDLTINLEGENIIAFDKMSYKPLCSIMTDYNNSLTIQGEGNLTINTGDRTTYNNYGIYLFQRVTKKGSGTLTINAGKGKENSFGISVKETHIEDGRIIINSGEAANESYGLKGALHISGNGIIEASAGTSVKSIGIFTDGKELSLSDNARLVAKGENGGLLATGTKNISLATPVVKTSSNTDGSGLVKADMANLSAIAGEGSTAKYIKIRERGPEYSIITQVSNGSLEIADGKTGEYEEEEVSFTAKANDEYTLESVAVKDANNEPVKVSGDINPDTGIGTYKLLMPASDITIEPIIKPILYKVTVEGSSDSNSGAGEYKKGATVTLNAGYKSGYKFTNWTSEDAEVVFADAKSSTTTFTMPDKAVAVKANFAVDNSQSGTGYVGSIQDQTADQDKESEPTVSEEAPNLPINAEISVKAKKGADKTSGLKLSDKSLEKGILKAKEEAKKNAKTDKKIAVKVNADIPKGVDAASISISRSSLERLLSEDISSFDVNTPFIKISFDKASLQEIKNQSKGDIVISAAAKSGLKGEAKKLIGKRPLYDIKLSYGKGKEVTDFGKGKVRVSIPYKPAQKEAAGALFAVHVVGNEKAEKLAGSLYDANSKALIFATNHFSLYGVGYTAPSEKFDDIKNHWAKDSIDYVVGRGLISGSSENKFSPNENMTREMLVAALGRLSGINDKDYKTNSFSDVKSDSVSRPYIEWAYSKGIVNGIGGGEFAPERSITREEIAVIFERYAKATGYTLPLTREASIFADRDKIGKEYSSAVTAMQQAGIMMGVGEGKFNPKGNATRSEVSSMLSRYIGLTLTPETAQGFALNDAGSYLYYKDGKALTGKQVIEGKVYFFDDGGELKTGFVKDGSSWRYYDGNKVHKGWLKLKEGGEEKTYYLNKNGLMESGKWLKIDGKQYYFYPDGSLAVNTEIDGYKVDGKGVRKGK